MPLRENHNDSLVLCGLRCRMENSNIFIKVKASFCYTYTCGCASDETKNNGGLKWIYTPGQIPDHTDFSLPSPAFHGSQTYRISCSSCVFLGVQISIILELKWPPRPATSLFVWRSAAGFGDQPLLFREPQKCHNYHVNFGTHTKGCSRQSIKLSIYL